MKVQILRTPDMGGPVLPVGTVADFPPLLARELTRTGEAVESPLSTATAQLLTVTPAQAAAIPALVSGAGIAASRIPWSDSLPVATTATSPAKGLCVRGFSETSGLTYSAQDANISATMSIDAASPLGGPALKLAIVNTAGAARYVDVLSGSTDINIPNFKGNKRRLVSRVATDDNSKIAQFELYFGTSGLSRFVRSRKFPSDYSGSLTYSWDFHGGPNAISDTLLDADAIRQYRYRVYVNAGQTVNVWVDGLYMPDRTPGFVAWTFDDNAVSLATFANLLSARGMHGTFGINTSGIGSGAATSLPAYGSAAMQYADLDIMAAAGHGIGSHNVNNTNITVAGFATYMSEYRTAKWDLHSRGILSAPFYHPCVQGVSTVAGSSALLAEGARVQRLVAVGNCEPMFRAKHLDGVPVRNLDTAYQLGSSTTAGSLLSFLQDAIDYGTDMVVMGHLLSASSYGSVTWPVADFTTLADAVKAAVAAGTLGGAGSVSEWCAYRGIQVK